METIAATVIRGRQAGHSHTLAVDLRPSQVHSWAFLDRTRTVTASAYRSTCCM